MMNLKEQEISLNLGEIRMMHGQRSLGPPARLGGETANHLGTPCWAGRSKHANPRSIDFWRSVVYLLILREPQEYRRTCESRVAATPQSSVSSTLMNAAWGISTLPIIFIRFFPSFCFSSSLRLRDTSPP